MNTASDSSASDLDKVIADYLLAVETGDECDLDTVCERHPDHAEGIRRYFNVKQQLFDSLEADDSAAKIEIEGFEILREIGRGGMGIVFEALQKNLNRNVAIKVLREGALASVAGRKRFEDEAQLIAKFQHDHIVDVIQYGSVDSRPYMVMPLATGKSLNLVIQNGPLPHQTVAKIMFDVADALPTRSRRLTNKALSIAILNRQTFWPPPILNIARFQISGWPSGTTMELGIPIPVILSEHPAT